MLRPELKTPLHDQVQSYQVQSYQAAGGKINTAVNSGKVTTGFDADKERARKKLAAMNTKRHKTRPLPAPRPFTKKELESHREWNIGNLSKLARLDAYTDDKGSRGHAVLGVALEKKL